MDVPVENSSALFLPLCMMAMMFIVTWLTKEYSNEENQSEATTTTTTTGASATNGKAQAEEKKGEEKKKEKSSGKVRAVFLVIGWLLTVYSLLNAFANVNLEDFDPYTILGLPQNATEADAKKVYRKLSLELHPDRMTRATQEEKVIAEKRFIRITQAYKALTDEKAKKNWLEHGHPDGPKGFSFNMGIPEWMTKKENAALILIVYLCFFIGISYFATIKVRAMLARHKEEDEKEKERAKAEEIKQSRYNTVPKVNPNKKKDKKNA